MLTQADDTQRYLVSPVAPSRNTVGGTDSSFRVLRRLGYDAAGETFLAFDEKHRRNFRLRLVPPGLVDEEHRNELADLALVAGSIGHPNLDTVYWTRNDEHDNLLIASEHHPGSTLRMVLADQGRLPWARARVILLQIADALAAVHAHGLAHLDLRAGNVLLIEHAGDGDQVKLVDFGLVPTLGGGDYLSECAAPEQIRGSKADARADVYAMGCLAYHVLAGEPPFTNASVFDRLTQQEERSCKPLRKRGIRVPEEVEASIFAAIEPDPARRPAGMGMLAEVFERCVQVNTPRPEEIAAPASFASFATRTEVQGDRAAHVVGAGTEARPGHAETDRNDSLEGAIEAALAAALPAKPLTEGETKPLPALTLRAADALPLWPQPGEGNAHGLEGAPPPAPRAPEAPPVPHVEAEAFPGRVSRATMLEIPALRPRPTQAPASTLIVHAPEVITPGVQGAQITAQPSPARTLMVSTATPPRTSRFSRYPAGQPGLTEESPRLPSGRHETAPSGRHETAPSGRHGAAPSGRHETAPSGRHEAAPSGRREAASSGTHGAAPSGRHGAADEGGTARSPSGSQLALRENANTLARDAAVARLRARTGPGAGRRQGDLGSEAIAGGLQHQPAPGLRVGHPAAPEHAQQAGATGLSRLHDPRQPAPFGMGRSTRSAAPAGAQAQRPRPRFQMDDATLLLRAEERRRARGVLWRGILILTLLAGGVFYAVLRLAPGL